MENKIYFQPEVHVKRKQRKETTGKNHRELYLIVFLAFVGIIILAILYLLRGTTKISGKYPENINNESITCYSKELRFDKTPSLDSDNKQIRINMIFNGEEDLKAISLEYTLNYATEDEAYRAEAVSHAELNRSLASAGYSTDKFENKFARYNNKLIISLFSNLNELDQISASFFMLNHDAVVSSKTMDEYEEYYTNQGFACKSTLK